MKPLVLLVPLLSLGLTLTGCGSRPEPRQDDPALIKTVAAWRSADFDGAKTSAGEIHNPNQRLAAKAVVSFADHDLGQYQAALARVPEPGRQELADALNTPVSKRPPALRPEPGTITKPTERPSPNEAIAAARKAGNDEHVQAFIAGISRAKAAFTAMLPLRKTIADQELQKAAGRSTGPSDKDQRKLETLESDLRRAQNDTAQASVLSRNEALVVPDWSRLGEAADESETEEDGDVGVYHNARDVVRVELRSRIVQRVDAIAAALQQVE